MDWRLLMFKEGRRNRTQTAKTQTRWVLFFEAVRPDVWNVSDFPRTARLIGARACRGRSPISTVKSLPERLSLPARQAAQPRA